MVIPKNEVPDCNGLPISDHHHKWRDICRMGIIGYDPKMRERKCKKCGLVEYVAPKARRIKK